MIDGQDIYEPDSFAGFFVESKFSKFQAWLGRCGHSKIQFDKDYIDHLRIFHGGRVRQGRIRTQSGETHVVGRFLNFAELSSPLGEYNVSATWSTVDDRMGDHLMPFAELFGGDLLCFDHNSSPPSVVVWYHERSVPDEEPYCEPVANNFGEFLAMLSDKP